MQARRAQPSEHAEDTPGVQPEALRMTVISCENVNCRWRCSKTVEQLGCSLRHVTLGTALRVGAGAILGVGDWLGCESNMPSTKSAPPAKRSSSRSPKKARAPSPKKVSVSSPRKSASKPPKSPAAIVPSADKIVGKKRKFEEMDAEQDAEVKKFNEKQLLEKKEANDNFAKLKGSKDHAAPPAGAECLCCMGDLDATNYVEYQVKGSDLWYPSLFCSMCVGQLLDSKWKDYQHLLETATCEAMVRRLLEHLPLNLKDRLALPCPDDGEVVQLWYASDKQTHSAQLNGVPTGEEREKYIKHMKEFAEAMKVARAAQDKGN